MEYNKILVPLDGSNLAESVLPHVEKIALGCTLPSVVLVTVTEPVAHQDPQSTAHRTVTGYSSGPCAVLRWGYRRRKRNCSRFDNGFTGDHRQDGQDRL